MVVNDLGSVGVAGIVQRGEDRDRREPDAVGLEGRNRLVPYTNSRFFHDPEMAGEVGFWRCLEKPPTNCQDVIPGLALESQHHDTGVSIWRIGPDVRKVLVERNEDALLPRADGCEIGVLRTAHSLVENCHRVVAEFAEEGGEFRRKIFVQLEPQEAGLLTGKGKDALLGQVGSVAHRSLHGLSCD